MKRSLTISAAAAMGVLLSLGILWAKPAAAASTAAKPTAAPAYPNMERATFAAGCFWCAEAAFEGLPGVASVVSGFSGGTEPDPTYEVVSSGKTGYAESVEIAFDPAKITYSKLLDVFWHNIDPTQSNGQFCDHGKQYRSAIFYRGDSQRKLAEQARNKLAASGRFKKPIETQIVAFTTFYPAEEYHQDYYKKNPEQYHAYRTGCGRDKRLQEIWGSEAPRHP
jgi:peptide-methionine (S)-S-oxide reductase